MIYEVSTYIEEFDAMYTEVEYFTEEYKAEENFKKRIKNPFVKYGKIEKIYKTKTKTIRSYKNETLRN